MMMVHNFNPSTPSCTNRKWRELGLAIVEVGDDQAQADEQVQQNRGDLEVAVAKLDGQS